MHQNHGLLHIKSGTNPFIMKSTRFVKKSLSLWIIFLVWKHDPKYFVRFIEFTNIHFFLSLFFGWINNCNNYYFGFSIYCFRLASWHVQCASSLRLFHGSVHIALSLFYNVLCDLCYGSLNLMPHNGKTSTTSFEVP